MTILFINGSPNKMGIELLQLKDCSEIKNMKPCIQQITKFMTTVKIFQTISSRKVIQKVFAADTLVIGSPVYRHSINGLVRNFLDRQYDMVTDELVGKKLFLSFKALLRHKKCQRWGIILCVAMRGFMEWIIWEW